MFELIQNLSRPRKQAFFFLMDSFLILASLYAAFALRFNTATPFTIIKDAWVLIPALLFVGGLFVIYLRLPRIKLHTFENNAMTRIAVCSLGLLVSAIVINRLLDLGVPPSIPIILGAVFFFSSVVVRLLGSTLLRILLSRSGAAVPVAVYGAGAAGIQLVFALRQSQEVSPIVFVDDNPSLWGLIVAGLKVEKPEVLKSLAKSGRINRVLVAMPSINQIRRDTLIKRMTDMAIEVQVLPSFVNLLFGNEEIDNLRTVAPEELLGRDKVNLDIPNTAEAYAGRVIMVTGAGGSIGSELCRQLVECQPSKIVLFEHSEFALYKIDLEIRDTAKEAGIEVSSCLGSVANRARVKEVLSRDRVEIVLHAAAYKHVHLVETNQLEGAYNNVIGTKILAEEAIEHGVERFILISTDKAVRPTNIMGATKRMAELVIQDLQVRSTHTRLSMVRFGNVLGSSGSVLPLFQSQILMGGPVTLTHPEVTRFFMTIPEAARLCLLAGALSLGGDLFVLDMGKPIKIEEIARRMIRLSGRHVQESGSGVGGIEIRIVGLRPGEKLYEELLIDKKSLVSTPHKKIMRANEAKISQIEVAAMLNELDAAISNGDEIALQEVVLRWVEGFHKQENAA